MPLTLDATDRDFISLDEVKAHANVTTSSHDAELDLFRGSAQEAVEGLIGPVVWRTVVELHPGGNGIVLLSQWPVLSVQSVVSSGVTLSHEADAAAGLVAFRSWAPVTVTYTVGRAVVPDSVRVAALIIAEHLWTTQRGTSPSQILQGDAPEPVAGTGYGIPNRAMDLLRPFLLPPAVA